MNVQTLMEVAEGLARRAGSVVLDHYGRVGVERKGDGTEVTAADRAAERLMREAIRARFPADGILGEEEVEHAGQSGRRWILDPIDGTRSFVSGIPLFGVLVGVEEAATPVVGCAYFPAIDEIFLGGVGEGSWKDGTRLRVEGAGELDGARLLTSGLEYWRDCDPPELREGFDRIAARASVVRTWGDAFGHMNVACGRADLLVDPFPGAWWDILPIRPILEEAGVRFARPDGGPVEPGKPLITAAPSLHAAAAALMGAAGAEEQSPAAELHRLKGGA